MSAEDYDEIAAALARFQAKMPVVPKTKTAKVRARDGGSEYSYTYADLAAVTAAAMPILAEEHLAFVCLPGPSGLVGRLLHSSGQYLEAVLPIAGTTPQQLGSSLTYMRRYMLGCLTGLVTDDDDDGQLAGRPPRAARQRAAAPPPPADATPPQRARRPALPSPGHTHATQDDPGPDGSWDQPIPETVAPRVNNDTEPTEPEPVPLIGQGQMRLMRSLLGQVLGTSASADEQRQLISHVVRRDLETAKALTVAEASEVIDVLGRVASGALAVELGPNGWAIVIPDGQEKP